MSGRLHLPFRSANEGRQVALVRLVVALVALSCLLMAAVAGWEIWRFRAGQLNDAVVATRNMVRVLASHAEATINVADLVLDETAERFERSGGTPAERQLLREDLQRVAAKANELQSLFVFDESGNLLAASGQAQAALKATEQEYFQYHAGHATRSLHVGTPVRDGSGVWVIPISRRLQHAGGVFSGVALATIRLDFFDKLYASLDTGKTGTILFALDSGRLYYRTPFNPAVIGRDISSGPIMQSYRTHGPTGTAVMKSRIDGITRLYSYRHLNGFPLIVAAGLSEEEIYDGWLSSACEVIGGLLCFVAMLVWLGRKLMRQFGLMEALEEQLLTLSEGLAQANEELSELASTDGLTQLANRRSFDPALIREYWRAKRNNSELSVVMFDVDWFKSFNDSYGHQAGDRCLQRVAEVLMQYLPRQTDLAARYGGEEFIVLLPETDLDGAVLVAQRICNAVRLLAIPHGATPERKVTISAGVATLVSPVSAFARPSDLVAAADRALYQAKECGRDRVAVAGCSVANSIAV